MEVQPARHAPFAVRLNWGPVLLGWRGDPAVWEDAGVWQFADCELQDIIQFVTVEVTGVESP